MDILVPDFNVTSSVVEGLVPVKRILAPPVASKAEIPYVVFVGIGSFFIKRIGWKGQILHK